MTASLKSALIVWLVAGFAFHAGNISAQETPAVSVRAGVALTTTSYSQAAAKKSNTVRRSFGVHSLFEPRFYQTVGLPLVLGWEYLGPICLDVDRTSDCSAGPEERTSLVFAAMGVAFYGPPVPLGLDGANDGGRLFITAGREWVSRGIGDDRCLNCFLDTVRFRGGLFIEPGLELPAGNRLSASISYRLYQNGADLENRLILRFSTRGALSY